MLHLMDKRPRVSNFSCSEYVYEDSQRKEVHYNALDFGNQYPKHTRFDDAPELFEAKLEPKEEGASVHSGETEIRSTSDREFTLMATETRKNFYAFHKVAESVSGYVESVFPELKKNLSFKMPKILDHQSLADYFERQIFKLAKNHKQVRKNWSEEETTLLISIIVYYSLLQSEDYGSLDDESWKYLASIYPGKKADQIKARWQTIYKQTLNKAPWHAIEDELLISIIKEKGPQHWKEIALELSNRNGLGIFRQAKQCRERWINHLDPNVKKGNWTEDEDVLMLKLFVEKGKKWAEIAKKLGGRTENNVKNRWISLIRKYKSELNFDENFLDHETDETSNWEHKLVSAIIACKSHELSMGHTEEKNGFSETLLPKKEYDEHDLYKSFETHHSSTNTLSPKSGHEDQTPVSAKGLQKRNSEKRKSLNSHPEIDLKLNCESKECFKDKLSKCSKGWHDFSHAHDTHHESQSRGILPPPKLLKTNSMDMLAEKMNQLPKFGYHVSGHSQSPYSFSEQKQPAQPTIEPNQIYSSYPNYPVSQQIINTNIINPISFVNNSLVTVNCYPQVPTDSSKTLKKETAQIGFIPHSQVSYPVIKTNGNHPMPNQLYPQASANSNNHSDEEIFHLAHKKLEKVPLEAQPDKDHLYFAMIDAKTHEIYLMSQVTPANYGQTFEAIATENQSNNFTPDDKDAGWPFDVRSNNDQEIPDVSLARDRSDFLFNFDEN